MKKEILVLEDSAKVKEIIIMHIESEFNVNLHYADSVEEAIDRIENNKNISLVVANYIFRESKTSRIYHYITQKELNIPYILITRKYPAGDEMLAGFLVDRKKNSYLKYPVKEHELVEAISKTLEITRPSIKEKYRRVRGANLKIFQEKGVPIYIMDNENEYIQCSYNIDDNSENDFYFVTSEDYQKIARYINEMMIKKLNSDKVNETQKIDLQLSSIEKIHKCLSDIGLSNDEIQLGEAVYESSRKIVESSKKFSSLIASFVRYKNYTYELSLMTSYLAIAMVKKTKWASEGSFKKLSLSAIFQDLSLSSDWLARVATFPFDDYPHLNEDDRNEILNHPKESMKLVNEVPNIGDISNNIQDIVLSHHERPHGGGFPKQLTAESLSGFASLFIMAHEFSHRVLEKSLTREILEKLKTDFEADYSTGRFRIPYNAFLEVFKPRK